jgi:DNA replication protein DnaC
MACARCDGTGWIGIERNGTRVVERCTCWTERVTSQLIQDARIPPRYARCTLDTFIEYPNEGLQNALVRARKFAESFPAVQRGLCLIGPPGVGKTHIAESILRKLVAEKQVRGLFYDVRDLLKLIRSTYNPVVRTAEMDILRPVMTTELLVLDDIGAEKPSEWVEETMNLIITTRYNEKRITILTTNFRDLVDETEVDSLKARVGFRLHSRLHEMCEFLEYEGADYRLLDSNAGPEGLAALWSDRKRGRHRQNLPARAQGQVRAQIREPREARELKWPGGKAERG